MNYFTAYIYLIFFVKLIFISCAITHIYLKIKGKNNSDLDKKVVYLKKRCEFLFIFLMAILLIYLFNPRKDRTYLLNGEPKLLLYLFGFVLIITADWNTFIHEAKWFKTLQNIIGKKE
jgi:hypothetical protein